MRYFGIPTLLVCLFAPAVLAEASADATFSALRDEYLTRYKPPFLRMTHAHWDSLTTGSEDALERQKAAEKELLALHSDPQLFQRLKALHDSDQVRDPVLRRELDEIYRRFLRRQGNPKLQQQIVDLEAELQQLFTTYRAQVDGRMMNKNGIRDILTNSTDSDAVEAVWRASVEIGRQAEKKLAKLVRLRNQVARELGYPDYYNMALTLEEIDEDELLRLFDELDELTREPFAQVKRKVDAERAAHFNIAASDMRPWHYADLFFQVAPPGGEVNLDDFYRGTDIAELCRKYFTGVGLQVDAILAKSDLYERPGKQPSAYCMNMDRQQDLRVITNLKPNTYWMSTILHEVGHTTNDIYIRPEVPFVLRGPAHGFTTEGVAMMFGAMARNGEFLSKVVGVDPAEAARVSKAARASLRAERLIFSRWTQVMVRFEQSMYSNPDQDLRKLWWDLKRRYQLLTPPDGPLLPDYAAKMHILTAPVYYHNYMMGELFASQVRHAVARESKGTIDPRETSFYKHPEAGKFLKEKVFGPGNLYPWNEYTKRATGEYLTAKYFALDLKE